MSAILKPCMQSLIQTTPVTLKPCMRSLTQATPNVCHPEAMHALTYPSHA